MSAWHLVQATFGFMLGVVLFDIVIGLAVAVLGGM